MEAQPNISERFCGNLLHWDRSPADVYSMVVSYRVHFWPGFDFLDFYTILYPESNLLQ